jgi:hypothetical protein
VRVLMTAGLAVTAAAALAACSSVAAPAAPAAGHDKAPVRAKAAPAVRVPPVGSQAEASALARLTLSRLDLPAGARRLPPSPVPAALRQPPVLDGVASVDLHELFKLQQPMGTAASFLVARVPRGMSRFSTGTAGGPSGVQSEEVSYTIRSVPFGLDTAQLVLTVAPGASGGSVLRADVQVLWYPPRSAAEYIDPAKYHVLTLTVTTSITGRPHTVRKVVTSQPAIARLAGVLNSSPVLPSRTISCPVGVAGYLLRFTVNGQSRPAILVSASQPPCEGIQISVDGRSQPPLQDATGLTGAVNRLLRIDPR